MYVHETKVKFVFELSLIPKILHHVNSETGRFRTQAFGRRTFTVM